MAIRSRFKHLLRIFPTRVQWKTLFWPIFWAILSGVALRFAFPPFEWGWIAWIGMAPFLAQLHGKTAKEGAWISFIFGFVYFYLNLMWLNKLINFNYFAPLGIVAAGVICALYLVLFGGITARVLSKPGFSRYLFVPALWVVIEFLRAQAEIGFPWMYLGHTQANYLPVIQIADLAGVYGISFIMVVVNLALADTALFFLRKKGSIINLIPKWAFSAVLLILMLVYGYQRMAQESSVTTEKSGDPFRVAIIQPGIEQDMKLASYADPDPKVQRALQSRMNQNLEDALLDIHKNVQEGKEQKPDLYILPESAITHSFFNAMPDLLEMVKRWANTLRAPVFFGANRYVFPKEGEPSSDNPGEMYNSAFIARPGKGVDDYYDKVHLVPFGEYSSYFRYVPFLKKILAILDFNAGARFPAFQVGDKSFGSLICFESCFPYLVREYDKQQVDFLTVVTNDAWYGMSSGPRRHQIQSIFRAVETRRPVVRAANTGISAIINPWGRVTASLPLAENKMQYMVKEIPLRPESMRSVQTLYMKPLGEWLIWLSLLYCTGVIGAMFAFRQRQPEPVKELARGKKAVAAK